MASEKNEKRKRQKSAIIGALKDDSTLYDVEKRYDLMVKVLERYYPILFSTFSRETLGVLFKDILYVDREIRLFTAGHQKEQKKLLSEEYIVTNL
jgi:hypothetical protein